MTWILIAGEGLALVLALAPGIKVDRWVQFGLNSLVIQWSSLLTLTTIYLLRHTLERRYRPWLVSLITMIILVLSNWVVLSTGWLILTPTSDRAIDELTSLLLRGTGISLTVAALAIVALLNYWRATQLAIQAKQAQVDALRTRIRPHFLFNTLNTGAALVHAHPEQAERLLLDLADLFRAGLTERDNLKLEEELSLVRRYLEIEQTRLGTRLRVEWDLPPTLPDIIVPSLSIQPLVENAIRHGIEPNTTGGQIRITLRRGNQLVTIEIRNNLPNRGSPVTTGHHVGLRAVRARIEALEGGGGKLTTEQTASEFISLLELPFQATTPSDTGHSQVTTR